MLHRGVPTRTATYLTLSDMLGAQILRNKAGSFTRDKRYALHTANMHVH